MKSYKQLALLVFGLCLWRVNGQCGEAVSGENGTISSPGSPGPYPNNVKCIWTIEVPAGKGIKVYFNTSAVIQWQTDCDLDNIKFTDVSVEPKQTLKKMCGLIAAETELLSFGNKLRVSFKSDESVNFGAWSFNWMAYDTGCDEYFTGDSGVIYSPGNLSTYPKLSNCSWQIEVKDGKAIKITFVEEVIIQYHASCLFDSLEFFDETNGTSQPIAIKCGVIPAGTEIVTSATKMRIVFSSDEELEWPSFKFQWEAYKTKCGKIFNDDEGTIKAPNYPLDYPMNMNCEWTIEADPGKRITAVFHNTTSLIQWAPTCSADSLEFIDDAANPPVQLRKLCGVVPADASITSQSTKLKIVFTSDETISFPGWALDWTASCPTPEPVNVVNCDEETVTCASVTGVDCARCPAIADTCCSTCQGHRDSCTNKKGSQTCRNISKDCEDMTSSSTKRKCKQHCEDNSEKCCKTCCKLFTKFC